MNFYYECSECKKTFSGDEMMYVCPDCSSEQKPGCETRGVLFIRYDIEEFKSKAKNIFSNKGNRDFFKYYELFPVKEIDNVSRLDVGNSPIHKLSEDLYIFDDTRNPSCSYKDRASLLTAAKALDYGVNTIVAASTGNAASSLACIASSLRGLKCILCVPENAPQAKITQMLMFGADVVRVKGTYDDAFELSLRLTEERGYFNRNTAYNPFTVEGKKSSAYEIFDVFRNDMPDNIFIPVGDGVIISGVYKGLEDLLKVGILNKMPKIVACQAEGSSVIADAYKRGGEIVNDPKASTLADSILVQAPRNSIMAVDFLKRYNGDSVKVSDKSILDAMQELASSSGVFSEPAAACAYAGWKSFKKQNNSKQKDLILITGNGLKDIQSAQKQVSMPQPISAMDYLKIGK